MGTDPLLTDATCWLIATDLDGLIWLEDAAALRGSARGADVQGARGAVAGTDLLTRSGHTGGFR